MLAAVRGARLALAAALVGAIVDVGYLVIIASQGDGLDHSALFTLLDEA